MPDGLSGGNDDRFQRNDPSIPTENALKGKGREGNNKREESPPLPDSRSKTASAEPGPAGPDVLEWHERVCEAAGYQPTSPAQIAASVDQVRNWRDQGLDLEQVLLPAIREVTASSNSTDRTRTLGRFRHAIARQAAKVGIRQAEGRDTRPPPPPILLRDDEDPSIEPIREGVLKCLGPSTFAMILNEVRLAPVLMEFGDERRPLKISGTEQAEEMIVHGRYRDIVLNVAKHHGYTDLWKGNGR